ncbi:hypothetical protein HK405_008279 [Cladochytrium tenue]|nr:hypothetical protein HK405_008279 [Cladochytrium tenue]
MPGVQAVPTSPVQSYSDDVRRGSLDSISGRPTWPQLMQGVAKAIETLEQSAARNQRDRFIPQSSAIVESIRVMLFVSGTARRDAPQIESHRQLRTHYKSIMASLSSLVLSAKLASGVWPPPDAINRMLASTAEVSNAVRAFVAAAQEAGVDIKHGPAAASPARTSESPASAGQARLQQDLQAATPMSSRHGGSPAHNSFLGPSFPSVSPTRVPNAEIVSLLDGFTTTVVRMIGTLNLSIQNGTCDSGKLITDVKLVVMEVGNFLAVVDDMPLDNLSEDVTVDFKMNRLALYNSVSELVMSTSTATSQFPPSNAIEQVVVSMNHVSKSIKDLLITTKFLLEEREARERGNTQESSLAQSQSAARGFPQNTNAHALMGTSNGGGYQLGQNETSPRGYYGQMAAASYYLSNPSVVSSSSSGGGAEYPQRISYSHSRSGSMDQTYGLAPMPNVEAMQVATATAGSRPWDADQHNEASRRSSSRAVRALSGDISRLEISGPSRQDEMWMSNMTAGGTPVSVTPTGASAGAVIKPWYMEYDYRSDDIQLSSDGKVKGGRLPALVERLTLHDAVDTQYVQAFLLTYRSFTTTTEFFVLLKRRFLIRPPPGLNEQELEEWSRNKKKPICLRVLNVMKQWIETYYDEDDEDRAVLASMKHFAATEMAEEDTRLQLQLSSQLAKQVERREQGFLKKIVVTQMGRDVPAPILPRNLKRIKFLEVDPLEIARQLTIIESKVYNRIQPVELLSKAWSGKQSDVAVNIKAMIAMSNQVSGWVSQSVLSEWDQQKRKRLLMHFIAIAEKCCTLNNFNTLMSVLAALNTAPIHRLKRTWDLVPARSMSALTTLRETMDSTKNFSRYRDTLHSANPPCVPFLGCYLTDLTFIEDGSPNYLRPAPLPGALPGSHLLPPLSFTPPPSAPPPSVPPPAPPSATSPAPGDSASAPPLSSSSGTAASEAGAGGSVVVSMGGPLINFGKRMKTSEVIREVQQYQTAPYLFTPVPELQEFLRAGFAASAGPTGAPVDEADLYNLSLSLEPREREDEKITRLLTESGFF